MVTIVGMGKQCFSTVLTGVHTLPGLGWVKAGYNSGEAFLPRNNWPCKIDVGLAMTADVRACDQRSLRRHSVVAFFEEKCKGPNSKRAFYCRGLKAYLLDSKLLYGIEMCGVTRPS